MNTRKILAIGTVTILAIGLSGCTWFSPKPTKEPMAMLSTGVANFAAKMSAEYALQLDATLLGKDVDGNPKNVKVNLSADGDVNSDLAALALNTKIKGTMLDNQKKYLLDTELRLNERTIFAMLNAFSGPTEEIPKEYVAKALNKWWKIPLPEALVKSYLGLSQPTPQASVVPGAKSAPASIVPVADSADSAVQRIKSAESIFTNMSGYIKNVRYDGSDKIGGLNSYRYAADLDLPKIEEFMLQYNKDTGSDLVAKFDGSVTFWVSVEGEILNRVALDLTINNVLSDDGKSTGKGNIKVDVSFMNFGKAVATVEPAGATEFDIFGILGESLPGAEDLEAPVVTK